MSSCSPSWVVTASSSAGRVTGCTRPLCGGSAVGRYTSRWPRPSSNSALSYSPPGTPVGSPTTASSSAMAPAYQPRTWSCATSSSTAATVVAGTARTSTSSGAGSGRSQPAQRRHRGPGAVQFGLQPLQVLGDQRGTGARVGGAQDALDVGQRDVELAQAVDDLGGRDLVRAVVAVAAGGVHRRGLQQACVVVAAQRSYAQVGQPGELADRQHRCTLHPLPGGESSA